MTEKRLNNCMLMHIHKVLIDQIDEIDIASKGIGLYKITRKVSFNELIMIFNSL